MENNLTVTINETELPVKEYQGQRVVTLKEIDAVHNRPEGTARKRFNDNKKHFLEGVDFFKVTASEFRTAFGGMDDRQQMDITLITESGYLMLVKSFTDDLAWTVQRQLVNVYFRATEDQRKDAGQQTVRQTQKLPPLSSVNMAMKLTTDAMKAAGVAPEYIVETAKNTYKPYGIIVPDDCITTQEHFMSQTEIAKRLGVMTKASGGKNPSASAVGGIIAQIGVEDREVKNAPFAKNGHSGDSKLYAESVAERVGAWLRDNEYPAAIKGRDGKNQRVVYDVRPGQ